MGETAATRRHGGSARDFVCGFFVYGLDGRAPPSKAPRAWARAGRRGRAAPPARRHAALTPARVCGLGPARSRPRRPTCPGTERRSRTAAAHLATLIRLRSPGLHASRRERYIGPDSNRLPHAPPCTPSLTHFCHELTSRYDYIIMDEPGEPPSPHVSRCEIPPRSPIHTILNPHAGRRGKLALAHMDTTTAAAATEATRAACGLREMTTARRPTMMATTEASFTNASDPCSAAASLGSSASLASNSKGWGAGAKGPWRGGNCRTEICRTEMTRRSRATRTVPISAPISRGRQESPRFSTMGRRRRITRGSAGRLPQAGRENHGQVAVVREAHTGAWGAFLALVLAK